MGDTWVTHVSPFFCDIDSMKAKLERAEIDGFSILEGARKLFFENGEYYRKLFSGKVS